MARLSIRWLDLAFCGPSYRLYSLFVNGNGRASKGPFSADAGLATIVLPIKCKPRMCSPAMQKTGESSPHKRLFDQ